MLSFLIFSFCTTYLVWFLCKLVGSLVPSSSFFDCFSKSGQQVLAGFIFLILLYRLPYRHDFPVFFADFIFVSTIFVALLKAITSITRLGKSCAIGNMKQYVYGFTEIKSMLPIFVATPIIFTLIFPALSRDAIFFFNHGPDLDGNLMSSAYLLDGYRRYEILKNFEQSVGSLDWWNLKISNYLALPDFRQPTAIEFFLRSHRWSHAVLTALISRASGEPVWFGFFTLVSFSVLLTSKLLVDFMHRNKLSTKAAAFSALLIFSSQSYVLMIYEGILVQLIATPIMLFLSLNWEWITNKVRVSQLVFVGTLISGLMSTYGEGVQIVAALAMVVCIFDYIKNHRQHKFGNLEQVKNQLLLLLIIFCVNPVAFVDFITWTLGRLDFNFAGGALHLHWSLIALLLPIPNVYLTGPNLPGINLIFSSSYGERLIEIIVLTIALSCAAYYLTASAKRIYILSIVIFAAVLTGHNYALWKVATALQPVLLSYILISAFKLFHSRVLHIITLALVLLNVIGNASLLSNYYNFAQPMRFETVRKKDSQLTLDTQIPFLTPSQSRIYLQRGMFGPLNWINGGYRGPDWEPNFYYSDASNAELFAYYDCDAEGIVRCKNIRNHNPKAQAMKLFPTGLTVSELLSSDGVIDRRKVNEAIGKVFNVNPEGNFRAPDPAFKKE